MKKKANAAKVPGAGKKVGTAKVKANKVIQTIHQSRARLFRTMCGVFSIEEETPGSIDKWISAMKRKHMPCVELKSYDKVPDEKLILT